MPEEVKAKPEETKKPEVEAQWTTFLEYIEEEDKSEIRETFRTASCLENIEVKRNEEESAKLEENNKLLAEAERMHEGLGITDKEERPKSFGNPCTQ